MYIYFLWEEPTSINHLNAYLISSLFLLIKNISDNKSKYSSKLIITFESKS